MMKSKTLSFAKIFAAAIIFTCFKANSTEVYKSKSGSTGPDQYKQYSMCRTNDNAGFIYSGTTKNSSNEDVIHIIRTDNSFNTTWSYTYEVSSSRTLNSTKIVHNYGTNGYWVSGYYGTGTTSNDDHYPLIMEIDENGSVLQHKIGSTQKNIFLDVEPTSDGGCIAVGLVSDNLNEVETVSGRRGLIVKFSSTLSVSWSRSYVSQYTQFNPDNIFLEAAENVTVVNSSYTSGQDYYFVMGSVSGGLLGKYGGSTVGSVPYLYYCYINNTGVLQYQTTCLKQGNAFDAVYDATDHKIYFVGKLDYYNADQLSIVGKINVSNGAMDYQKRFEGNPNGFPYAHLPIPYKIELNDDELMIFGYVRDYIETNMSPVITDIMIPFNAVLNKSDASEVSFTINHTQPSHTQGYPSEEPGFLYNWDNASNLTFSADYPSIYAPEPAIKYIDDQENVQWGMVGYYNITSTPPVYSLHFFSSQSQQCDPLDKDLSFDDIYDSPIDLEFSSYNFTTTTISISQNLMGMNDDSCN
jgi:hypothetical protein